MDQVRVALQWMKRHHFWLLGVLVPLLALGAWFTGASYLQQQYTTNSAAIKKAFDEQTALGGKTFYPNDDVNENQREQIVIQAQHVAQIWEQLYDRQREQVLKWPDLGGDFLPYIRNRNFGDPIRNDLRNLYHNYAKETFSKLPKIVGAREVEGEVPSGGFGGMGGYGGYGEGSSFRGGEGGYGGMSSMMDDPTMFDDSLVRWHDQMNVKQQLYFTEQPSAIRIWVTQEDLWVYETLLRAVAATNKAAGADRYSNAAVRDIIGLQVGKLAAQESRTQNRIEMPQAAPGTGMGDGGMYGPEGTGGVAPPTEGRYGEGGYGEGGMTDFGRGGIGGGDFGSGPMTEEQEKQVLLFNRYIGPDGKPVAEAVPVEGGEASSAGGEPFKRLPVRMVLNMDQRWLSHLVTELANAPLQVEVQEVRINPQSIDSAGAGGMMGGEGYGRGGFGGGGMGGEGGYMGPGLGTAGEVAIFERQPHVTPVVIQGTIYIFNKPDPAQLQPESSDEATDASGDLAATPTSTL